MVSSVAATIRAHMSSTKHDTLKTLSPKNESSSCKLKPCKSLHCTVALQTFPQIYISASHTHIHHGVPKVTELRSYVVPSSHDIGCSSNGPARLERGSGMISAGIPSFLGLGVRGRSYSNFLASTVLFLSQPSKGRTSGLTEHLIGPLGSRQVRRSRELPNGHRT